MIFYVYALKDPRNNKPFYIGKGKGDRYSHHFYKGNLCERSIKNNKIKSILNKGLEVLIEILHDNLSENRAFLYERVYIRRYGRKDNKTGILCNHTDGGDGFSGLVFTDESKLNMSISALKRFKDPKEIEKISKSHIGQCRPHNETTKDKISKSNKRRIHSELSRINMSEGKKKMISENLEYYEYLIFLGKYASTEEGKQKISNSVKELWKDPIYREKQLEARRKKRNDKN